jgi:hypothetical protein
VNRLPGTYARVGGRELPVTALGREEVWVEEDGVRRPIDRGAADLEVFQVDVLASWHGEPVALSGVRGAMAGILTNSNALAEREGLAGDQYGGWHGEVAIAELTDVVERVRPIPRRTS